MANFTELTDSDVAGLAEVFGLGPVRAWRAVEAGAEEPEGEPEEAPAEEPEEEPASQ